MRIRARVPLAARLALLACAAVAVACTQPHDPAAVEVRAIDQCVSCHLGNYQATTSPAHAGQFPTTCADCHLMTAWHPALSGPHPETQFPIAGGPHHLACLDCHRLDRGSSAGGANTDCIGCHLGTHVQANTDWRHGGVVDYSFRADIPNDCLRCHPQGTAPHHPEALFPIQSGAHRGILCGQCHDARLGPSTGGQNTNCLGCHPQAQIDPHHRDVRSYVYDATMPHFCLRCHPSGRAGN
jgi:hypothetical protein